MNTPVYIIQKFSCKNTLIRRILFIPFRVQYPAACVRKNGSGLAPRLIPFILALICLFVASCSSAVQRIPETVESSPTPQSEYLLEDEACDRPYAESSIWNVPIDWSVAKIHPDSKKLMDAFWSGTQWIGSDPSQYAPNLYFVNETTPLVSVKLRKNRFRDAFNDMEIKYGEPASTILMPIPRGAQPAPGTDGQLVIINTDTGEEWGINEAEVDLFGNWLTSGAYRYSIRNSGIPPAGFGQRGAGIGNFSGIIRQCEVERGTIEHAVTLAYDYPCAPGFCQANGLPEVIPPFSKTDGRGLSKDDIPEGARIIIHPEISNEEIIKACSGVKGCIVWVVAMQKFGGFIVDNSDHPKTYPEGNATANWDPKIWSKDMLRNIPPEWYDVIDWNFPVAIVQ